MVAAVNGERAFPHPGAGVEPDPGMELARAVTSQTETTGGDAERVPGAQRWIVAGEGLVEVDAHRLWRGDLPVGRGTGKRLVPSRIRRTHERILRSHLGPCCSFLSPKTGRSLTRPRGRALSTVRVERHPRCRGRSGRVGGYSSVDVVSYRAAPSSSRGWLPGRGCGRPSGSTAVRADTLTTLIDAAGLRVGDGYPQLPQEPGQEPREQASVGAERAPRLTVEGALPKRRATSRTLCPRRVRVAIRCRSNNDRYRVERVDSATRAGGMPPLSNRHR